LATKELLEEGHEGASHKENTTRRTGVRGNDQIAVATRAPV